MKHRFAYYYAASEVTSLTGAHTPVSMSVGSFRDMNAPRQRRHHHELRELEAALTFCRLQQMCLRIVCPVEWLDDARFLKRLRDTNVPVAILDSTILADNALDSLIWAAEKKRRHISERTRAGLRLAKRNGTKLGNPCNLSNRMEGSRRGVERRKKNADERATRVGPLIERLRNQDCTYSMIAKELERQHVPTERGGAWTAAQVARVLARLRSLKSGMGLEAISAE